MTMLGHLESLLREALPLANVQVTEACIDGQPSWLDIALGDRQVVVEWTSGEQFGISSDLLAPAYGAGADELLFGVKATADRVAQILGPASHPPQTLQMIRKTRRYSQKELGEKLGMRQAGVSKLERRHDMPIATLRAIATALGGDLELTLTHPRGNRQQIEVATLRSGANTQVSELEHLAAREGARLGIVMRFPDGSEQEVRLGGSVYESVVGGADHDRSPAVEELWDNELRSYEALAANTAVRDLARFRQLLPLYTQALVELPYPIASPRADRWAEILAQAIRHSLGVPSSLREGFTDEVRALLSQYSGLRTGRLLASASQRVLPELDPPLRARPRVLFLVPEFGERDFIADLSAQILARVSQSDWDIVPVIRHSSSAAETAAVMARLASDADRVDAAIVVSLATFPLDHLTSLAVRFGKSLVFVDINPFQRSTLPPRCWFIGYANDFGSEVARFLVNRAVSPAGADNASLRVFVVGGDLQKERQARFTATLKQAKVHSQLRHVHVPDMSADGARASVITAMREHGVPDIIFATTDDMALGAEAACDASPKADRVSIVGWDGIILKFLRKGSRFLATVVQDRKQLAKEVVDRIERDLAGDYRSQDDNGVVVLQPTLATRPQDATGGELRRAMGL